MDKFGFRIAITFFATFLILSSSVYGQIVIQISSKNGFAKTFEEVVPTIIYVDTLVQKWDESQDEIFQDKVDWLVIEEKRTSGYVTMGDEVVYTAATSRSGRSVSINLSSRDFKGNKIQEYILEDSVQVKVHTIATYDSDFFLVYSRQNKTRKYDLVIAKFTSELELSWKTLIGEYRVSPHRKADRLKIDDKRIILMTQSFDEMRLVMLDQSGAEYDNVVLKCVEMFDAYFLINRKGRLVIFGSYNTYDAEFTKATMHSFVIELDDDYSLKNQFILTPKYAEEYIMSLRAMDIVQDSDDGTYYLLGKHGKMTISNGRMSYPIRHNYIGKVSEDFEKVSIEQIQAKSNHIMGELELHGDEVLIGVEGKSHPKKLRDLHLHAFSKDLEYLKTHTAVSYHPVLNNICSMSTERLFIGGGISNLWLAQIHTGRQ